MTAEQPDAPRAQSIAMRIIAGTMPLEPGMDPNNPLHVLRVEFGPVAQEIRVPESNVERFLESVTHALRTQVEAARAERLGAQRPGLIVPGGMPLGAMPDLAALRERRQ